MGPMGGQTIAPAPAGPGCPREEPSVQIWRAVAGRLAMSLSVAARAAAACSREREPAEPNLPLPKAASFAAVKMAGERREEGRDFAVMS